MLTINKKIAFEIVKYCFERLNVVYVRLSKKHCQMYMKIHIIDVWKRYKIQRIGDLWAEQDINVNVKLLKYSNFCRIYIPYK